MVPGLTRWSVGPTGGDRWLYCLALGFVTVVYVVVGLKIRGRHLGFESGIPLCFARWAERPLGPSGRLGGSSAVVWGQFDGYIAGIDCQYHKKLTICQFK